ncbi:hypothetical protein ACER0C_003050 [Sarotherodon galilaeus]
MNRKRMPALKSLVSNGKDMFAAKLAPVSGAAASSMAKFTGRLGSSIAVITSLIVGFLTLPNNIIYFLDHKHSSKLTYDEDSNGEHRYAYIHAGIALVVLGCLAMVVSIVLSYFAANSKRKVDASAATSTNPVTRSTMTVYACLAMMNVELFMAVIAGCMELLYRPLTSNEHRSHNVECAIAVFNIIIYVMYVVTMILTASVLQGKHEKEHTDSDLSDMTDVVTNVAAPREYVTRGANLYNSPTGYMM